ncbi:hypothetical protein BH10ACT2_BH10ACT2_06720 [soil metagenome]
MTPSDPPRRKRLFWWWFVGVSVVLIVAMLFVRLVILNDKTVPLTTDEALERYRSSTTAAESVQPTAQATATTQVTATTVVAQAQTLPTTGVYRYATVGRESIDALDGTEHTYPDETTITYTATGCGVEMRWDALVERHDEWNLCVTDAGIELQPNGGAYHMFFGQEKIEPIECDRSVVLLPANTPSVSGNPVSRSCTIGGEPWAQVWKVLDRNVRTVGGTKIDVQHVRFTVDDNDAFYEHITLDWYLDGHGLLIEAKLAKLTYADTVLGGVTYKESYTLMLVSTTPLR